MNLKDINTCVIDFDGTAFNTIKAMCDLYNEDYAAYQGFKPIDWHDVHTWEFSELELADPDDVDLYFNQKRFFDIVEPMPDFEKVLEEYLSKKFHIIFCSMGSYPNLNLKETFLKYRYPHAQFIGLDLALHEDKSSVDMSNAIMIDDSNLMLRHSNAPMDLRILYGDVYPWNQEWNGTRCKTWTGIKDYLGMCFETEGEKGS